MLSRLKLNFKLYLLILIIFCFGAYQYINFKIIKLNINNKNYILEIAPKENFKSVLNKLKRDHVLSDINKNFLYILAKLYKYDRQIQAGEYLILPGTTAAQLIQQLIHGKVLLHKFTIVEGLRFEQILSALQQHPKIKHTVNNHVKFCATVNSCEGLFLANTYLFPKNTQDIVILQEAYDAMQTKINNLWELSNNKGLLKSSYEALILASIIEKETSRIAEMTTVSGVYHRRLQKGMLLQADPTIVYGLKIFDRGLKSVDLKQTSEYNTYLNKGLPPTPIATPSIAAIVAALNPAAGESLFFVADGSGGHVFSSSFAEHRTAIVAIKNNKQNKK